MESRSHPLNDKLWFRVSEQIEIAAQVRPMVERISRIGRIVRVAAVIMT
jgi:hypothetical protein